MVPKNCIKKFKKQHKIEPSLIEVDNGLIDTNKLKDMLNKSTTLWSYYLHNSDGISFKKLLDYDPSGIMIYLENNDVIFILSTEEKMNVANFTLSKLKKK